MKNVTRRIASTQSIALGAAWVTALIAPPAFAQQPIERVEITGSSIKRIDAETALPVQIVSRQEIESTGSANVEQFLQGLGVALQGNSNSVVATASGATTGGVSSVSLGGCGWGANGLLGFGDFANDRYNATMSFDYRKQDPLYGRDRPFASSGISVDHGNDVTSGNTFPANFTSAGTPFPRLNGSRSRNPFFGNCPGPYSIDDPFRGSTCGFDPSPLVALLPDQEQKSIFTTLRYAFASNV